MKNFKKVTAAALTSLLAVGVIPTIAFAAGSASDATFNQVLDVGTETTAPNVTIKYAVTPLNSAPADAITIPDAQFNASDSVVEGKVSKNVQMNIQTDKFTSAGVYTYKVKATATSTTNNVTTSFTSGNDERILELIMGYETNADGVPQGDLKVLQAILKNVNTGDTAGTKNDGFTVKTDRENELVNLQLTKTVKGNLADKDHYFGFNVVFTGTPGTQITVNYDHATEDLSGESNIDKAPGDVSGPSDTFVQPSTITIQDNGEASNMIYLKHGQTVEFQNIPENTTYKISEVANDQPESKYTTTWSIAGVDGNEPNKSSTTKADDNETGTIKIGRTSDHVTFVNSLSATVETGVVTTIAPFATIMVLAALGYVAVKATKRED